MIHLTFNPGDWITGPFWEGPVRIVALEPRDVYVLVTVAARDDGTTHTYVLTTEDQAQVARVTASDRRYLTFGGDAARFRLAMHAHRLRLAHAIDPYAALNASRIDPLPHQFEAVYEHLLARPVVRALLAHDAGAGKTIMAGMLIKELQRRQRARRVLVVAPAGLIIQWRRELLTKFGLDFVIVDRDHIQKTQSDNLLIWRETDRAITSVDFAKQKGLRQALQSVEWDLVIVDEAHKMAAYKRPSGTVRKTLAYELGETLSRHTTHFLLMTATPHKGDPDNYRLLIRLIDPLWGDAAMQGKARNPLVLRRTKEEMRKADGSSLYPARIVAPLYYHISREEGALVEDVCAYARRRYARVSAASQSAAFALLTLERRMASSPYALCESLKRMRTKVQATLDGITPTSGADATGGDDWAAWEELTEADRWQREAQAEAAAAALVSRRQARAELRPLDDFIARAEALVAGAQQAKLTALKRACALWVGEQGEQLIVFTEFKDTLDYLVAHLEVWGYTTTQIHGGMALHDRREAERVFWLGSRAGARASGPHTAPPSHSGAQILVATEAAGEGINLQCCSVMVNYDIPWNPCRLEQRMGRIHRYGQRAPEVHIFNLIAKNTLEGEVQDALLQKLDVMCGDLGDKVFNVVGEVLWGSDLRQALERIALGERAGVDAAKHLIERAEVDVRRAQAAETRMAATAAPLNVADFRRRQATFAAHRLSPEEAEKFFLQAVTFVGGALDECDVKGEDGVSYPAFTVSLPDEVEGREESPSSYTRSDPVSGSAIMNDKCNRSARVSFWPAACSDDPDADDAVLFIAPGHWLFEALLDRVLMACAPDLAEGAVFLDLQPDTASPYLVWFVQAAIRDGLGRHAGDLLAAVQHRADQEQVTPLPTEILDAFDLGAAEGCHLSSLPPGGTEGGNPTDPATIRQGQAMLAAQDEILDACVTAHFLPQLADHRAHQSDALVRDRRFLAEGLDALAAYFNDQALEAYGADDSEEGERLTERSTAAQGRKRTMLANLDRAGHLLLTAPEVLGVALVLPAPLEVEIAGEAGTDRVVMRRDDEVEDAAMQAVMAYEARQGRHPRDVHRGHSWDIESYDADGNLLRYIEVKGRGPADAAVVTLTAPEWEAARRLGDQHWLYIVRLGDGMLWMVQNPYAKLQPKALQHWVVKVKDAAARGQGVSLDAMPSASHPQVY